MLIAALVVAPLAVAPQDAPQGGSSEVSPPASTEPALELGPGEPDGPGTLGFETLGPEDLGSGLLESGPLESGPLEQGALPESIDGRESVDLGLDRELPVGPWARVDERGVASGNLRFGGWLRASLLYADRDGTNDMGGDLEDLRLLVSSRFEGIDLVLASEAADGDPELTHAYAFGRFDARHEWIVGRFRVPFLQSAILDEDRLLFTERTLIGESFDIDELGIGLRGAYPYASFSAALQNAEDETRDALRGTIRTSFHLPGQEPPRTERVSDSFERPVTSLSLAYTDDATFIQGDAYAVELDIARAGKRFSADWVDRGDGFGGGQPWSVTGGFALDADGLELGLRYQDFDDAGGTRRYGAVVARSLYADLVRWQASVEQTESDDPELDGLSVTLAVVLSL